MASASITRAITPEQLEQFKAAVQADPNCGMAGTDDAGTVSVHEDGVTVLLGYTYAGGLFTVTVEHKPFLVTNAEVLSRVQTLLDNALASKEGAIA
jgi:hypothetical protein